MKIKKFLNDCWLFITWIGLGLIVDILFWSHALTQIYAGRGLEPFKLGNVDLPKFLGAGATYLDVFILNMATLVALIIALYCRYRYYESERAILAKSGREHEGRTGFLDDIGNDD